MKGQWQWVTTIQRNPITGKKNGVFVFCCILLYSVVFVCVEKLSGVCTAVLYSCAVLVYWV